jgi:hypothetical protein
MAKGDEKRARSRIDEQKDITGDTLERLDTRVQDRYAEDVPRYQDAANKAGADYSDIMGRYKSLADTQAAPITYNRSGELSSALKGYQGFADTGGFSANDTANMRARGISPIRAVYANAQNELGRQRALQGGYSPNYTASIAKMSRGLGESIADQTTNVEAQLAQMRQQGQLAGLQGLGGLSIQDLQLGQNAQALNAQQNRDRYNSLSGMSNLFGTTPGMANMFRNQVNEDTGAMGQQAGLMNQRAGMLTGAQNQASQIPGTFETNLNRVGQIGNIAGNLASIPFGGINPGAAGKTMSQIGEYW